MVDMTITWTMLEKELKKAIAFSSRRRGTTRACGRVNNAYLDLQRRDRSCILTPYKLHQQ
eukprot:1815556-Prorocentrum_lima.AAC.1